MPHARSNGGGLCPQTTKLGRELRDQENIEGLCPYHMKELSSWGISGEGWEHTWQGFQKAIVFRRHFQSRYAANFVFLVLVHSLWNASRPLQLPRVSCFADASRVRSFANPCY